MRWFHDHMQDGVTVRDLGDEMAGFSLAGPKSRAVIERLTEDPVGALPFMGCGDFDIGLMRCKVGRMSVSGELGYEIHCRMGDTSRSARRCWRRARTSGITEYGFNALLSLRLEKSFGIWSRSSPRATRRARPAWTAGSTGTRAISSGRGGAGRTGRQRSRHRRS
jgi:dimethylglycine dehydrogenase